MHPTVDEQLAGIAPPAGAARPTGSTTRSSPARSAAAPTTPGDAAAARAVGWSAVLPFLTGTTRATAALLAELAALAPAAVPAGRGRRRAPRPARRRRGRTPATWSCGRCWPTQSGPCRPG